MFWKSVATILALSVILTAQAESQEEVTVKEANIQIDVSKIEGKINRDVAGIMTDPPRPDWLKKHLASLSMAGGEKGAELHGDGANAFWLPVINPSFINCSTILTPKPSILNPFLETK